MTVAQPQGQTTRGGGPGPGARGSKAPGVGARCSTCSATLTQEQLRKYGPSSFSKHGWHRDVQGRPVCLKCRRQAAGAGAGAAGSSPAKRGKSTRQAASMSGPATEGGPSKGLCSRGQVRKEGGELELQGASPATSERGEPKILASSPDGVDGQGGDPGAAAPLAEAGEEVLVEETPPPGGVHAESRGGHEEGNEGVDQHKDLRMSKGQLPQQEHQPEPEGKPPATNVQQLQSSLTPGVAGTAPLPRFSPSDRLEPPTPLQVGHPCLGPDWCACVALHLPCIRRLLHAPIYT